MTAADAKDGFASIQVGAGKHKFGRITVKIRRLGTAILLSVTGGSDITAAAEQQTVIA